MVPIFFQLIAVMESTPTEPWNRYILRKSALVDNFLHLMF